jgi:phage shock protein B
MGEVMPFLMVIAIIAIVFASKHYRTRMMMERSTGRSADDERLISDMTGKIEKLSSRVAVLEKLLTDEDRTLAAEIERLRRDDRPSV